MNLVCFSVLLLLFLNHEQLTTCYARSFLSSGESNSNNLTYFQTSLDSEDKYHLFWSVDYESSLVTMELRITLPYKYFWFAIGFSDYGQIENADLCILWLDHRMRSHFQDVSTDDNGFVNLDQVENCKFQSLQIKGRVARFVYQRSFDTCDPHDYVIEDATNCIVYAMGKGPLKHAYGLQLSKFKHGFQRVHLLKHISAPLEFPDDTRVLDVLQDSVHVPSEETTYWCKLHLLPKEIENKQHIVQYEAVIEKTNEGLVHHMELFHCEVPAEETLPDWDGSCFDKDMPERLKTCKRVIAAWAMGAEPFAYPAVAGLPFGGHNYSRYAMLEVHYNNPELRSGVRDSSGLRLYYTKSLRKYDVGILEIGLEYTDKNSIPPKQEIFELSGYCVSECTRVALPPTGIYIFASQLHTHLTGTRVWTRHVREGKELSELNRDNYYSTHFQEIRHLKRPVHLLPGDALINTCRYNTLNRDNITLGGFGISDEMCVNYMHYYPKTNLEVCKSSIDTEVLYNFFDYLNTNEGFETSSSKKSVAENYNAIKWTPHTSSLLNQLYIRSPLSMQCNHSDGNRFPGYWNGMPTTQIYSPLKQPKRQCDRK